MADGPEVIPLFRGGPLRKTGGCLILLLLIGFELGVAAGICYFGYALAETYGMVSPLEPDPVFLLLGAPFAALALWGIDRMAKAMVGISPFRIVWELLKVIP